MIIFATFFSIMVANAQSNADKDTDTTDEDADVDGKLFYAISKNYILKTAIGVWYS